MKKMLMIVMGTGVLIMTGCEPQEENCSPASGTAETSEKSCNKKCCPGGCAGAAIKTPKLAVKFESSYKNPDGMTIKDGEIWLTINNVAQDAPSCIVKVTKGNQIEKVIDLPISKETGVVSALGLVFASDGNLYVSDNQNLAGKGYSKSRVLRVVMKDGKVTGDVEVVATGLHAANGIAAQGDSIFVNETTFGEAVPLISGTYQFKLADLKAAAPIKVDGSVKDPHVIFSMQTEGVPVGANGLCFDCSGNMYVANFGDKEIWQVAFDADGSVSGSKLFTTVEGADSIDGLQYDGEGFIWFADFLGCAVFKVCVKSGKSTLIAKSEPGDGVNGELDAPSECIKFGNKVYVANIDLTFGPNTADETYTLSVIELD